MTDTKETVTPEANFISMRINDLQKNATVEDLAIKTALLEYAVMDLIDSVLDPVKYPDIAVLSVPVHFQKLDKKALQMMLDFDKNGDYVALWDYAFNDKK